jgi:hypothetical protein
MALETKTREIDGTEFRVTQLGFATSRKLLVRITKSLGPALALFMGAGKISAKDFGEALEGVDDAELEHLSAVLEDVIQFGNGAGKWPQLDKANREIVFSGRILTFFKVLGFALEVQYADFFDALKARSASVPAGGTPASSPA